MDSERSSAELLQVELNNRKSPETMALSYVRWAVRIVACAVILNLLALVPLYAGTWNNRNYLRDGKQRAYDGRVITCQLLIQQNFSPLPLGCGLPEVYSHLIFPPNYPKEK